MFIRCAGIESDKCVYVLLPMLGLELGTWVFADSWFVCNLLQII